MIKLERILQIVVLFVAGVAINLAVAWSLQLLLVQKHRSRFPVVIKARGPDSQSGFWLVDIRSYPYGIATTRVWSLGSRLEEYLGDDGKVKTVSRQNSSAIPSWSIARQERSPNSKRGQTYFESTAGWPMRSWYGAFDTFTEQSVWAVQSKNSYFVEHPALYPYRPMFFGFIVNSVLYAVCLACLFKVMSRLRLRYRQAVRRGKGLCPHCAYNITGLSTCPECGQPVKPKPTSSSKPT